MNCLLNWFQKSNNWKIEIDQCFRYMQTNEYLFIPKVWFTLKNMESIWRWIFHQTEDYPYSQWKSGRLFSPSVVCCSCFKLTTRLMPPASSVGDDHAALQQDSIHALVQFSDSITEDHKKIWISSDPSSSRQRGWCPLPPWWGMTMQHSSKIQCMLMWSFQIQSLKITKRSE